MKRWSIALGRDVENRSIDAFLKDIEDVCKWHEMTISHEDFHGAFIIDPYSQDNIDWLFNAHDNVETED